VVGDYPRGVVVDVPGEADDVLAGEEPDPGATGDRITVSIPPRP